MCGICGIIRSDRKEIDQSIRDRMQEAIKTRGPDQSGQYNSPGIFMGINRLSIIDLKSGDQPVFNEDGTLLIVYNGEIYNHLELRHELESRGHIFRSHSDTETVLHAFEEYGVNCLSRFNGMFAFAIFNKISRKLFLARDRLGIKPLYIANLEGSMAFASETKALLPLFNGAVEPDWTAISRFLSFGYVPSPDSPFKGIRKLPAAHYAWYDGAYFDLNRYWKPIYGLGQPITFKEAKHHLIELLEKSIAKEMISDVPIGVFLSGGLDSSTVAAFARKHNPEIHSYGLKFPEQTHDESADARTVAEHIGLIHHEFLFTEQRLIEGFIKVANILDEPFADPTVLPLMILSEHTRKHVKVVLTGWGGDEIFAGYPTYKAHNLSRLYRRLPAHISKRLIPFVVNRLPVSDKYMSFEFKAKRFIRGMDLPPEYQHFIWMGYFDEEGKGRLLRKEILNQINENAIAPIHKVLHEMDESDDISRILHLDALYFLEGNGLFEADRMTMAASLEARVPLLNIDILDYVNPLPYQVKMPGGKPKELLRQAMADYLPASILRKPKKGFGPPTSSWIRGPFAKVYDCLFNKERVESQGIFNFDEICRLISEHRSRKFDHGRNLWAVLSFQLWFERFILDNHPKDLISI